MPLRLITIVGFVVSFFSFLLGAWALIAAFSSPRIVPGWASTVIPIYLICGVQLTCLGIMGEYIGKIYYETKRRPRFTIETALLENESEAGSGRSTLATNYWSGDNGDAESVGRTSAGVPSKAVKGKCRVT